MFCIIVALLFSECFFFFFFKQKTAYEMRISDWSSDVCSSDLFSYRGDKKVAYGEWDAYLPGSRMHAPWLDEGEAAGNDALGGGELQTIGAGPRQIGRASCRERVCQYV